MNFFSITYKSGRHFVFILALALIISITLTFTLFATASSQHKKPIDVIFSEQQGTVRVKTELADYLFSTTGGNLQSIFIHFSSFRTSTAEVVPGITINPNTLKTSYLQDTHFPGELKIKGESDKDFKYKPIIPEDTHYDKLSVTFAHDQDGITIRKRYTLFNDSNYTFGLDVTINNQTGQELNLSENTILYLASRAKAPESDKISYLTDPTAKFIFDGAVSNGKLARNSYSKFDGVGLVGKNLVLFLKTGTPYQPLENTKDYDVSPYVAQGSVGVNLFHAPLEAESSKDFSFSVYGGRRRHVLLSNVGLEEIDDTGFFSKLLVPVIQFLNQLYKLTGNYAWAIILFTVLIRVLLYPLMRNMYRSMAKMQELQPKIKEIQNKYDDREKQQKKMMALYKEENVNPMGGCLPMFIQLPILILLWRAIMYSAEAIHLSPGFLWLNDLSLADPYYILVVLTVATMIIQQQMMQTPGGGGSQNKIMSYGFPLFMGIFLRDFPAGLWLYYFLTQIFMIGQQSFINWEMERAETEKNEG